MKTFLKGKNNNKYDIYIKLLICLQVFGVLGGALQPIRLLIIIFWPLILVSMKKERSLLLTNTNLFFLFWIIYALLSLMWVIDFYSGVKEVVYLMINFSIIPILSIIARKSINPILSIIQGWLFFVVLTLPIAFYEILTNHHIPFGNLNIQKIYIGHNTIRKYASVTFGNLNGYNQILIYAFPFLLAAQHYYNKRKHSILMSLIVLSVMSVIVVNSSRATVLCMLITLLVFFFSPIKKSINKRFVNILIVVPILGLIYLSKLIFVNINARISNSDSNILKDDYRERIFYESLKGLENYNYLGVGAGNFSNSINHFSKFNSDYDYIAPHNFFLEIVVQYGFIILFFFCLFLVEIFKQRKNNIVANYVIKSSALFFILSSVVSSSHLLSPSTWVFLGSLYILTRIKEGYNLI